MKPNIPFSRSRIRSTTISGRGTPQGHGPSKTGGHTQPRNRPRPHRPTPSPRPTTEPANAGPGRPSNNAVHPWLAEYIDRRQLVLPVATTILAGRDGQASRPPASSCAGHRLCRYTVRVNSIDTPSDSHNCHYVNHSVREIRPPVRWRIASARFDLPRLRMRCIIRPRVVVPAIPSAPVATHSIAPMLYEVSRPSGTFLIPDCTPAEHPNSRRNTRSAGCIASGPH